MPTAPPIRRTPNSQALPPVAVLIDGSALFLTVRSLIDRNLDYKAFIALISRHVPGVREAGTSVDATRWVMWTSVSPQNEGQNRFLDFAENQLHWEVRRFSPADSFIVEPSTLFGAVSDAKGVHQRLLRFDASIAFALGRLAENHRIVVVSDGFGLADPMIRAAKIGRSIPKPTLAFFGRALDSRWQRLLRVEPDHAPRFLDLDDHEDELFGVPSAPPRVDQKSHREDFVF